MDGFQYDNGLRHERVNVLFLYEMQHQPEMSLLLYCGLG